MRQARNMPGVRNAEKRGNKGRKKKKERGEKREKSNPENKTSPLSSHALCRTSHSAVRPSPCLPAPSATAPYSSNDNMPRQTAEQRHRGASSTSYCGWGCLLSFGLFLVLKHWADGPAGQLGHGGQRVCFFCLQSASDNAGIVVLLFFCASTVRKYGTSYSLQMREGGKRALVSWRYSLLPTSSASSAFAQWAALPAFRRKVLVQLLLPIPLLPFLSVILYIARTACSSCPRSLLLSPSLLPSSPP